MSSQQALAWAALVLAVTTVLVVLCYFFVDAPVAIFSHNQHFARHDPWLKWLAEVADVLGTLALAILVLGPIRSARRPLTRLETTLLAAAASLMLVAGINAYLKWLFGRCWPETWIHANRSLIRDGAAGYGFNFFSGSDAYGSFPSGHTARTMAALAVPWFAYPRWRWLYVLPVIAVVVGLVGMDYHFVGDCAGGAGLGFITGLYTAQFFYLTKHAGPTSSGA
jgi:membrane-associated phospholipid phosphatase